MPAARTIGRIALLLGFALLVSLLAYLAVTIPAAWFPAARALEWTPAEMAVTRGHGVLRNGELVAAPADASGLVVISLPTRLRSGQYPVIRWKVRGLPDDAEVRLLWRTDYAPAKMNAMPMTVSSGRLRAATVHGDNAWLGNVLGIALAVQGAPAEGIRILGATAAPMGAVELTEGRVLEWLAFEPWNGASINTLSGGAEDPGLPLPALLFAAVLLAGTVATGIAFRRGAVARLPVVIATCFMLAWALSDVRWTWNLVRQARATAAQYAGKDLRERHLAGEDGKLYGFIEKAKQKLPATPVRILVAAEAAYHRGRAAYHLYPNNVYFEPGGNTLPRPDAMQPGDYVLVYQRRGVQFDSREQRLRWDGNAPVPAELVLLEPGAALFRLLPQ